MTTQRYMAVKVPRLPKEATAVDWGITKFQLRTVCASQGFLSVFLSTALPDLPNSVTVKENADNKIKTIKTNSTCMTILMESLQDNETVFVMAIIIVEKIDWPMSWCTETMKELI